MSSREGKGSILLEILIVVLAAALIAVIIIPGKIWNQEKQEEKIAHDNISAIYQAEKFYHRVTEKYTTDPSGLLRVIEQDSTLKQADKVVNYTRTLKRYIGEYLNIPYIRALAEINQNINNIQGDLESNKRNFKPHEDIKNEADYLKMQLGQLNVSAQFPNYVSAAAYLDSLGELRRAITDFKLQVAGAKAKNYTDTLQVLLPHVNVPALKEAWMPLSKRLEKFIKMVKRSDVVKVSSVADRVQDFKNFVDESFVRAEKAKVEQDLQTAQQKHQELANLYQTFLKDFIVTTKLAVLRLSEADSLVLHLTQDNFYSPVNKEMYKIMILDDSTSVKVESPVLLKEIKEKALPIAEEVGALPALPRIKAYLDTLSTLENKGLEIKRKLRRNTDVFIAYKSLQEVIGRFSDISFISAYKDLQTFAQAVPVSESFSEIKSTAQNALTGVQLFKQAYTEQVFGNLDSLHLQVKQGLQEFDSVLAKVRRLPKGVQDFHKDITMLDSMLQQIKKIEDPTFTDHLGKIEKNLEDLYLFASKGKTIRVYGVFSKKIKNFGYIYRDTKSWEEEAKKK